MNPVDVSDVPWWIWGGTVTVIGVAFGIYHLVQLVGESISVSVLIGALIPLLLATLVTGLGLAMVQTSLFSSISPWVTLWLLLGMTWMSIAGLGAVLYGSSAGVITSTEQIPIFATYGCLPGVLTGWYDGRRRQHLKEVSTREEQLAILSRIFRHNFRNKMTVILGQIDALGNGSKAELEETVDVFQEASEELMETTEKQRILVETLLDPSPIRNIDGDDLLRRVATEVEEAHPEAEFTFDIESPCPLRGVPELECGLKELLENSVEHNESVPPQVSIQLTRGSETATIHLQDNGSGIPDEELAPVTEAESITPLNHGSGLGLRLASLVVDQSDGIIRFSGSKSGGSDVRITLTAAN